MANAKTTKTTKATKVQAKVSEHPAFRPCMTALAASVESKAEARESSRMAGTMGLQAIVLAWDVMRDHRAFAGDPRANQSRVKEAFVAAGMNENTYKTLAKDANRIAKCPTFKKCGNVAAVIEKLAEIKVDSPAKLRRHTDPEPDAIANLAKQVLKLDGIAALRLFGLVLADSGNGAAMKRAMVLAIDGVGEVPTEEVSEADVDGLDLDALLAEEAAA